MHGARLSALKKVANWAPVVWGPTFRPEKVLNWAQDSWARRPNLPRAPPNCHNCHLKNEIRVHEIGFINILHTDYSLALYSAPLIKTT